MTPPATNFPEPVPPSAEPPEAAAPPRAAHGRAALSALLAPDALVLSAEQLIVRGKEAGYLTPDDVLAGFPEMDVEPDHLERVFQVFRDMGIEVTDGDKDFAVVEDDEELVAT
ncbi:MAG: RNA polymerase sigma factor region1.1 domain-containing protein, partial [Candidatus Dormibacteria bacterium]